MTSAKGAVGFRPFRAIFDAEGCESRLRCLMQGGKSGVWLGLVGCCATCSPMHPGQMSIFPTQQQVKRAKIEPKGTNPTAAKGLSFKGILPRLLAAAALAAVLIGCGNPVQEAEKPAGIKTAHPGTGNPAPEPWKPDADTPLANRILTEVRKVVKENPSSLYFSPEGDAIIPGHTTGILLMAPGGPDNELDPSLVGAAAPGGEYHRVLVRQRQMERGVLPADRFITPEEAKEINLYSAAALFALAEHFQARGRRVVVQGSSFGAFLLNETLRRYGYAPFTRIIMAVGRIDMPPESAEHRSRGIASGFKDGRTLIRLECDVQNESLRPSHPDYNWRRTQGRLQADLTKNRYSEAIPPGSLGKIIYYFGGKDPRVGALTDGEVYFLTGRRLKGSGEGRETKITRAIIRWIESIEADSSGKFCERSSFKPVEKPVIHIVRGLDSSRAVVKYAPEEGHQIPSLTHERRKDILAVFLN